MHPSFFLLGISLLILAGGLGSLYVGRKNQGLARASASWPRTTGTITALNIAEVERSINDSEYIVYRPEVTYTYTVADQTFAGQRLGFGDQTKSGRDAAEKLLAPYQLRGPAQVFYDPADPQSSTLSTKASGTLSAQIMGVLFTAVGIAGVGAGLYWAAMLSA